MAPEGIAMKQEAIINLGDNDHLMVAATDADVRLTFDVGKPASGCPSSHNWSISARDALSFARGVIKAVERLVDKP